MRCVRFPENSTPALCSRCKSTLSSEKRGWRTGAGVLGRRSGFDVVTVALLMWSTTPGGGWEGGWGTLEGWWSLLLEAVEGTDDETNGSRQTPSGSATCTSSSESEVKAMTQILPTTMSGTSCGPLTTSGLNQVVHLAMGGISHTLLTVSGRNSPGTISHTSSLAIWLLSKGANNTCGKTWQQPVITCEDNPLCHGVWKRSDSQSPNHILHHWNIPHDISKQIETNKKHLSGNNQHPNVPPASPSEYWMLFSFPLMT